jgi:hypothetical protein
MNREFIRIADVDRADEFLFIVHHPNHALDYRHHTMKQDSDRKMW